MNRNDSARIWRVVAAFMILTAWSRAAGAQNSGGSIGVDGLALRLPALGESPVGGGVRVTLALAGPVALDGALSGFPSNPSGNFGERLWLVGARVRLPIAHHDVFVRVRGGSIYFGGSFFDERLSSRTRPALDAGVTVERTLSAHLLGRFDISDLIVPFGGASYLGINPTPDRLGTTNNLLISVGLAWRF